jgi:hypothetical protein
MYDDMQPPTYQDGYPRFDIVKAKAALERELTVCEFSNGRGMPFGVALMDGTPDTHFTLKYAIALPFLATRVSSVDLELAPVANNYDPYRVVVLCPGCSKRKIVLVFRNSWKCAACHGLLYRSQCMTTDTRHAEKRNAIKKQIKGGRPKGMQNRTYARLVAEYRKLTKTVGKGTPLVANDVSSFVVTTEWRTDKADDSFWFLGPQLADG